MNYYQIIKAERQYNKDEIESYHNANSFTGTINLDRTTPIKEKPFITLYYAKNIYDSGRLVTRLENQDQEVIILLKKDKEDIYTVDNTGDVLRDNFINYIYNCNDKELKEQIDKIGSMIIKENYYANSIFKRSIRLEDNQMIIKGFYTFDVDFFDRGFIGIENDNILKVSYDDILITTDKYKKANANDIENILFDILVTEENYSIAIKDELCICIREFFNRLKNKYGKINNIFMIDEIDIIEGIFGLLYGTLLFIETEKKLVVISAGIYD